MRADEIIRKAKSLNAQHLRLENQTYYLRTMAWLSYLGLIRHSSIKPRRFKVSLTECLNAAKMEPRIFDLLPAILTLIPKALSHSKQEIPKDLGLVLVEIKRGKPRSSFHGIPPERYQRWLSSAAFTLAKRKLEFRKMPRHTRNKENAIGSFITQARIARSLTQVELARDYHVSLRVLRDLEQGKLSSSIDSANEILAIFGSEMRPD